MSNLSFSLHPTKVVTHNSISQNNSKTSIPLHSTPQHMEKTNIKAEKGGQEELNKEQINYHFYKEFCRLTIARDILKREIESCKSQIEAFKNKDSQEKLIESFNNIRDNCSRKERRKRRTAVEIERKYRCRYRGCNKSYGSEGSLNQHMKNKHPKFYQKFLETLNINNIPIESPKEYEYSSSSSTSKPQKRRNKKEEEKTEEIRPLPNSKKFPSLRKKNNKN
ncbi:unnamed protein product [Moneuplotes crassus]|uniref:C2H2-type domain-containing protein n=1 Tax=Euplotes crassus TaxID=5936 RepID=A0AAD1XKF9_EUPCR|nr:unnamed protein product [Moneuplotes crassus]